MDDDKGWMTIREIADRWAGGYYWTVHRLVQKGALPAERERRHPENPTTRGRAIRIRVSTTAAHDLFGDD